MREPTRLVLLSDIHRSKAEARTQGKSPGKAIEAFLGRLKPRPHAIIVSGDIEHSAGADGLKRAKDWLKELITVTLGANVGHAQTKAPGTEGNFVSLCVCPGNHDVRQFFGLSLLGEFTRRGPFAEHFQGHYAQPMLVLGRGVVLVPLDTTKTGDFARGGVFDDDVRVAIERADALVAERQKVHPEEHYPVRIAIGHHHLLPVVTDEGERIERAIEPLMVMDRPGSLIQYLIANHFAAYLHGHRHVPSEWLISRPDTKRERGLLVLGNGSSTDPDAYITVLDIAENGPITYQRYHRSKVSVDFSTYGDTRTAFSSRLLAGTVPPAARRKDTRPSPHSALQRRNVIVSRYGDVVVTDSYEGLWQAEDLVSFPVGYFNPTGALCHPRGQLVGAGSHSVSFRCEDTNPTEQRGISPHQLEGKMEITPAVPALDVVSLIVETDACNAAALTRPELLRTQRFLRHGAVDFVDCNIDGHQWEFTGVHVRVPAERLEITLGFEREAFINAAEVEAIPIQIHTPPDGKQVIRRLASSPLIRLATSRSLSCAIVRPVVGDDYGIAWLPPDGPTDQGEFNIMEILQYAQSRVASDVKAAAAIVSAELGNEEVQVSLTALDLETGGLTDVATTDTLYKTAKLKLAIGEGIAGRAYKTNELVLWMNNVKNDPFRSWYKYGPKHVVHSALASYPVKVDRVGGARSSAIVVVSLGSYIEGSQFHAEVASELSGQGSSFLQNDLVSLAHDLVASAMGFPLVQ